MVTFEDDRPSNFAKFDRPDDPTWLNDTMIIRYAVALHKPIDANVADLSTESIQRAVGMLDKWCARWGLKRIGKLEYESWNCGRSVGVATHCKIVDIKLFVGSTKDAAYSAEYGRIRRLAWWRRLFMPLERKVQ